MFLIFANVITLVSHSISLFFSPGYYVFKIPPVAMCTNTTVASNCWVTLRGRWAWNASAFGLLEEDSYCSPLMTAIEDLGLWSYYWMATVNGSMVYRYRHLLNERWQRICCYWLLWLPVHLLTWYWLHSNYNQLPATQIILKWTSSWMSLAERFFWLYTQ